MKVEQKTRDITLWLIQILVWFEILWAIVFLVGLVFQWSGLTDQLAAAFFCSGFCVILVIAALAVLNITANLNIISKVQVHHAVGAEPAESKPVSFIKTLSVAAVLIVIVVASLWFAEWRLYKSKESEIKTKIESIAETKLIDEAINLINSDSQVSELGKVREALTASIQTGARLSLIFPLSVKNIKIYYELTAWSSWDKQKTISEGELPKFVPTHSERKKWEKLLAGEMSSFSVPSGVNVRVFHRVKTALGEVILLIDTSRRSDYSRGSFD